MIVLTCNAGMTEGSIPRKGSKHANNNIDAEALSRSTVKTGDPVVDQLRISKTRGLTA
jgi:hypothetical protein